MGVLPVLAAVALCAGSAAAAHGDFHGCCADLDERVAELEQMAVRKGNRKVKLTISGWVNEALFMWDDGTDKDAYVGTNLVEQSRFRFLGEAKIAKDWSAGYLLEIGVAGHPSNQWDQDGSHSASLNPNNREFVLNLRKSNWFLKHERLGQAALGLNAMATYHLLDDGDSTLTRYVDDGEAPAVFLAAFRIRINGNFVNGLRWGDVLRGFNTLTPGQGVRRDVVRYDSPTVAGFTASATWGEDDLADAALNYKGDIGDFSLLAKGGYGWSNDPGTMFEVPDGSFVVGGTACISGSTTETSLPNFKCTWAGGSGTLMHNPTGLFVYGGVGEQTVHTDHVFPAGTVFLPTSSIWFVQPGIERKWLPLGKTNIFGQYRHDDPGSNPGRTVSASIEFWQGGVVQYIDAAAATFYLVYQHTGGEVTGNAATEANGAPIGAHSLDPFQEIIFGAKFDF